MQLFVDSKGYCPYCMPYKNENIIFKNWIHIAESHNNQTIQSMKNINLHQRANKYYIFTLQTFNLDFRLNLKSYKKNIKFNIIL